MRPAGHWPVMDCVWDSLSAEEVGVGRLQILFFLCTSPCSSDTRLCGLPPRGSLFNPSSVSPRWEACGFRSCLRLVRRTSREGVHVAIISASRVSSVEWHLSSLFTGNQPFFEVLADSVHPPCERRLPSARELLCGPKLFLNSFSRAEKSNSNQVNN